MDTQPLSHEVQVGRAVALEPEERVTPVSTSTSDVGDGYAPLTHKMHMHIMR